MAVGGEVGGYDEGCGDDKDDEQGFGEGADGIDEATWERDRQGLATFAAAGRELPAQAIFGAAGRAEDLAGHEWSMREMSTVVKVECMA